MDDKAASWQNTLRSIVERQKNQSEKSKRRIVDDRPLLELPVAPLPNMPQHVADEPETYCENAIEDILQ
jgi:hypothetical protein